MVKCVVLVYYKHNEMCCGVDFPGIHLDDQVQPTIPPPIVNRDYSHEAEEYEKKLIQVHTNITYIMYISISPALKSNIHRYQYHLYYKLI